MKVHSDAAHPLPPPQTPSYTLVVKPSAAAALPPLWHHLQLLLSTQGTWLIKVPLPNSSWYFVTVSAQGQTSYMVLRTSGLTLS